MTSLYAWALSPGGQAIAAWTSAILSLIAVTAALIVALVEQRRANAERVRLMKEDSERRASYGRQIISLARVTINELDQAAVRWDADPLPNAGADIVATSAAQRVRAIDRMQSAMPADAALALATARTVEALRLVERMQALTTDPASMARIARHHSTELRGAEADLKRASGEGGAGSPTI